MADAFGGDSGGGVNLKRFVATPAFLIIAGGVVLFVVYMWFKGKNAGATAAQAGVVANPVTGPPQGPEVLSTLDTTGIQQQLSNLVQQVSTGNAANAPGSSGVSVPAGELELGSPSNSPNGVPVWRYGDQAHQGILEYLKPGSDIRYLQQATGYMGEPGWIVDVGGQQGFISGYNVAGVGAAK